MNNERPGRFARLSQVLVDASPDALIAMSPAGDILFWNNGAERIFGYTPEEAVGRTIFDLIVPAERVDETRNAIAAPAPQRGAGPGRARADSEGAPAAARALSISSRTLYRRLREHRLL
jgi:PAS domain-containing protein